MALDQLAAYVNHLNAFPRSPYRAADGAFTAEALQGREVFLSETTGCSGCHLGSMLTDSGWGEDGAPVLHDVGTLTAASGKRLGMELPGLDTPTLLGVQATAPYGHRGQATTLHGLWDDVAPGEHGRVDHLTDAEFTAMVRFLLELEGPMD